MNARLPKPYSPDSDISVRFRLTGFLFVWFLVSFKWLTGRLVVTQDEKSIDLTCLQGVTY
jgi:hypothetical protein